jgi:hypothetical protein
VAFAAAVAEEVKVMDWELAKHSGQKQPQMGKPRASLWVSSRPDRRMVRAWGL